MGAERTQLLQHPEVVADGPTLGDLPILEAVHRGEVPKVGATLDRKTHEDSAGPVSPSPSKLDDVITHSDHNELIPVLTCHLMTPLRLKELARPSQARRSAGRQRVIDHVGLTQVVQLTEIVSPQERIESLQDLPVVFRTHGVSVHR
jgi:hypothetical protein